MLRALTKEEIEQNRKEIEEWWKYLDGHLKSKFYHFFKNMIEQIECVHEYIETTFYDKKVLSCKKCPYMIEDPEKMKKRDKKEKERIEKHLKSFKSCIKINNEDKNRI